MFFNGRRVGNVASVRDVGQTKQGQSSQPGGMEMGEEGMQVFCW